MWFLSIFIIVFLSLTISLEKLFFLGVSIINEFVLFETKQQEQLKDRV